MSSLPRRYLLVGAALSPIIAPLVAPTKAGAESAHTKLANVRDFGAAGDGVADDTVAIEDAFARSGPDGTVFFPPGNYRYNGTGLHGTGSISVIGASNLSTKITLGPNSYFINYSSFLPALLVREISFEGGKGAIRHTFAGVNVAGYYLIQNCQFTKYAQCAISTDAADMPYWHIENCVFDSANTTGTIGVALPAGTDQCVLDSCSFIRNRIHIKARGGNNLHISRSDMLQFSSDNSGGARVAVWIVPDSQPVNAGTGLTITRCKFGNENLSPGDYRVLYADELPGVSNGEKYPQFDSDSEGYVAGHILAHNAFFGTGGNSHPLIFSTTPNVKFLQVCNNVIEGGQPSYVLQFRSTPTAPDRLTSTNLFGPFTGAIASEATLPFPASNADGIAYWQDPIGLQQLADTVRNWTSGTSASFRQILFSSITSFTATSGSTTEIADAFGGADAVQFAMVGDTASLSSALQTKLVPGMPLWVEFDISAPSDQSGARQLFAWISDDQSVLHWRRCVQVPSADHGWTTYAFTFTPRSAGSSSTSLVFAATGSTEVGKAVNLGRVHVYQANERQVGGMRPAVGSVATTEAEAISLVNDLRKALLSLGLVGESPPS